MNSPTGQPCQRIFTLNGSNDADLRKDAPFGVLLILLSILGVKYPPKTPNFWGANERFKPNGLTIESFLLSKLLHQF